MVSFSRCAKQHNPKLHNAKPHNTNERSKVDIRKALAVIFAREGEHFSFAIKQLTALQVQILTAIARRGGKGIYSGDFLNFSGVKSTASVRRAMSRLVDEGLVYAIDGEWTIDNPFFAEWVKYR